MFSSNRLCQGDPLFPPSIYSGDGDSELCGKQSYCVGLLEVVFIISLNITNFELESVLISNLLSAFETCGVKFGFFEMYFSVI